MSTIEKALSIALKAHRGAKDKAGAPYILHPLRLMMQMETAEEMICAVLHDVIEDSELTLEDLGAEGFSSPIVAALDALTHRKDETYEEFIQRAKQNELARKIKLADLADNMDLSRLSSIKDRDRKRQEKYHAAHRSMLD